MYFKDFSGEIHYNENLTHDEILQLETLLLEFKDLFAFDSSNVDQCNVLEFTVDTVDCKPINKNSYRYSTTQRMKINR